MDFPSGPIGVFDSGYGGLTVYRELRRQLPQYDYLYLGDNARAPYGPLSFDEVYAYTKQCVQWLIGQGCPLIILACNTASAKALRTIQQNDLAQMSDSARVLGVIRPTAEMIGYETTTGSIGVLGTAGTVRSQSYLLETEKFFPELRVEQEACPEWVDLVEAGEQHTSRADAAVKRHLEAVLERAPDLDVILLACTHYPLLMSKIKTFLPNGIKVIEQGPVIAASLIAYLERHPEIRSRIKAEGRANFYTTGDPRDFDSRAAAFAGEPLRSEKLSF